MTYLPKFISRFKTRDRIEVSYFLNKIGNIYAYRTLSRKTYFIVPFERLQIFRNKSLALKSTI